MASSDPSDADRRRTTTHTRIRSVVEDRDGYPARESGTDEGAGPGKLTVTHRGDPGRHAKVPWKRFFEEFQQEDLVFVYPTDPGDGEVGSVVDRSE